MSVKDYALTTAQRVADYAGLGTLSGTNLIVMERLVDSVTEFIENYTHRRYKKTTYTQELYNTENAPNLQLRNYPVDSSAVFSLERRTSGLNNDEWAGVDGQYFHVDNRNGVILSSGANKFDRTTQGYRVTYTAGYDYDNVATFLSDTEAGDIEFAAWMLLEGIWNKRKGGFGIESEKIGDYSVKYRKEMMENDDLKAILDKSIDLTLGSPLTPLQV